MRLRIPWIIIYAVALHLIWAGTMFADESAIFSTAPSGLSDIFGTRFGAASAVLGAALLAGWALWRGKVDTVSLLALLPQQMILILSAAAAAEAIWGSQFADGVVRPRAFILTDQIPAVLIAIAHTAAILDIHMKGGFPWRRGPSL